MNSINGNKQHKKNKQVQQHKTLKTNYPFKQHNSKNTRIAGKTIFFIDWKQNKQQDKTKNTNQKQKKYKNKANIETERLKHTPWKQKQEQQKKQIDWQYWKQLGLKRGC